MAMSNGNNDFVVLSNSSIATSAANPSPLTPCDGDHAAQQLTPKEATRTKTIQTFQVAKKLCSPDSRLAGGGLGHVHHVHRSLCLGWSISARAP
ncbi:dispatched RND transporter family member 1 [Homo sapiens]|uniref:Dispatched RND transporter family member 1 n=1 Tax=Homo sapiens TaxID=9606 RepID=A0A6Q8PFL8_HUMAN|nr:dispatched RND transporter family member 1 [Homo sapiens]KAI4085044.1 dispatched RND transporter family member 1 [Homo sapiens]